MATLDIKTFSTLVSDQVAAVQSSSARLLDLTIGSVLRVIVEANAAVAMWLQGLVMQTLAMTRAATSSGADLDSWVGDYGVTRLAAIPATGTVTFSRFTTTQQAVVPTGSLVQTSDGSQQFAVTVDTTNPAYNASLGGYVILAGVGSINTPVQAQTAGLAGNAVAGSVSQLFQSIAGVDTVTNTAGFINGADAESDAALRIRFVAYLSNLSKATRNAVGAAVVAVQQGLSYSIVENFSYAGAAQAGYFYVVVDDGSGAPSASLLSNVQVAVDAVRPLCSSFGVFAPSLVTATVGMTVTVASGYDATATKLAVKTALQNYINGLGMGVTLRYSRLTQVAYDASTGVSNVSGTTLNGVSSDLAATPQQIIRAGTVTVS